MSLLSITEFWDSGRIDAFAITSFETVKKTGTVRIGRYREAEKYVKENSKPANDCEFDSQCWAEPEHCSISRIVMFERFLKQFNLIECPKMRF